MNLMSLVTSEVQFKVHRLDAISPIKVSSLKCLTTSNHGLQSWESMSNVEIPFCFFSWFFHSIPSKQPNNQRQLQKRKFDFIHTWAIMGATGRYHCLTFSRFIRSRISWLSGTASKERCPKALGPNSCRPAKKPRIIASQNYRKIYPLEESWHFCWNIFFVIQAYQSHVLSGHVFTKLFIPCCELAGINLYLT